MALKAHGRSSEIAAILLAAGRSRRMGAFKPLLPFGDRTVIEWCIANLQAADIGDIVIVVGHRADEICEILRNVPVRFVTNPNPDSEMGTSIAYGVREVKRGVRAILIALVDHPAVDPATIRKMIEQWELGALLIQPRYKERGGHPVLIDASCRNELLHLDPGKGLRGLFEAHSGDVLRLQVNSTFVARDMDTWEDYIALHQEIFGRPPRAN